jgi:hypothetical protein
MLFREFRIDFLGSSAFAHFFSKREKWTASNKNLLFRKKETNYYCEDLAYRV